MVMMGDLQIFVKKYRESVFYYDRQYYDQQYYDYYDQQYYDW